MFKRSLTTEAFDAVSVEQKSINSSTQYDLAPLDKFLSIYSVPIHWVLSVGIVFVLIYLIFEQAAQAELLVKNDRARLNEIQALKTQFQYSIWGTFNSIIYLRRWLSWMESKCL
jgi:hypothetical protein